MHKGRATHWNVNLRAGVIVGYVCPSCQTAEEWAEAEINEATLEYNRDAFGRARGVPRV
jgi:hypothetical protein